jgi:hypothetical protein
VGRVGCLFVLPSPRRWFRCRRGDGGSRAAAAAAAAAAQQRMGARAGSRGGLTILLGVVCVCVGSKGGVVCVAATTTGIDMTKKGGIGG